MPSNGYEVDQLGHAMNKEVEGLQVESMRGSKEAPLT